MRILAVGAIVALLGTGCATVTRGTSQSWTVETDPVGADVRLSSGETCKTPCTLKKKRKHAFTVDITKEGYEPVTTGIVSSVSGAGATGMAGNVLVGGLIGIGIDAGTGAAKDLKPNPLVVKMVPTATLATPASVPVATDDATTVASATSAAADAPAASSPVDVEGTAVAAPQGE